MGLIGNESRKGRPSRSALALVGLVSEGQDVLFLDIETTGLSRYYDQITMVGWEMNGVYEAYITGDDPARLFEFLRKARALVTFNGTLFDLPFLRQTFDGLSVPPLHLDLRYAARRVGLTGGQKTIEKELRISVREDIEGLDGLSAVLLWHEYLRGDKSALRKLIRYNQADVRGMTAILDHVVKRQALHLDLFRKAVSFHSGFKAAVGWARPRSRLPDAKRLNRVSPTFASLFSGTPAEHATIVGIDLTGSEQRPSGFCVLTGDVATTAMLGSDADLMGAVQSANPLFVSIDSPLSLPKGRINVYDDDPGRDEFGIMRQCERTLKRRGINVYPCLLPSMQRLTERGMALAATLRRLGVPVIESYPGAAQDIIGIPRKGAGIEFLRAGLAGFGLKGPFIKDDVKHDELDAITSALVGAFFFTGKFEALTGPTEGALIIPDLKAPVGPLVIALSGAIAAGKTEAARMLERRGFTYSRFSQVVDDVIVERNLFADRKTRQDVGEEIHEKQGQRWLCEKVIERAQGADRIVIDGVRFREDFSYLFEQFGDRFRHIHLVADRDIRASRAEKLGISRVAFEQAETRKTESEISLLMALPGTTIIVNQGTLEALEEAVTSVL